MEITYIAHSCFEIKTKDLTIITDPYDSKIGIDFPKLSCDVLLVSHSHYDHSNVSGVSEFRVLVDTPGEYDVADTTILGYQTYHDDKRGELRGKNTIYLIEADGFKILHLGDLGHELSKETLEKLPEIDVLMIPVGGVYTINAETATKVISSLEPAIVVPMHYQTNFLKLGDELDKVDKFLNAMGADDHKSSRKIRITKRADIPEETEVHVLSPTAA